MSCATLAVNLTFTGEAGARQSSVQMPAAATTSAMDHGYCGFAGIKLTHKSTVRPAGLPRGSTG